MENRPIRIGDKVRSFDFAERWPFPDPNDTSQDPAPTHTTGRDLTGDRAFYVEGYVMAIVSVDGLGAPYGCDMYRIEVSRKVSRGVELEIPESPAPLHVVNVPVNGTQTSMGDVADGVERIGVSPVEFVFAPGEDDTISCSFRDGRGWRWSELHQVYGIQECLRAIREIEGIPESPGDLVRDEYLCMTWMDRHGLLDWRGQEHLKAYRKDQPTW